MFVSRILAFLAAVALGLLAAVSLVPFSQAFLPHLSAPAKAPPAPVLISIEDLAGESWPWPRLDLTLALRAMSPYRPEPVGLLLPLDAPDTFEPAQDDQLARALAAYLSPALSATAFSLPTQADTLSLPKIPHTGSITSLRAADSFFAPEKNIQRAAQTAAWKVTPESDGLLCRLPLVFRHENAVTPSWLLSLYAQALGADLSHSTLAGRRLILRDKNDFELQAIPLDRRGSVPIDWSRPDQLPEKMEIRGVVLAAEQERIGVRPYYDLKGISKRPAILAGGLAEVDPIIDSPIGRRSLAEAVVRTWTGLTRGPAPVLHPPSWTIFLALFLASALGFSSGKRGGVCLGEAIALAGLVMGAGWIAAKTEGYAGAFPLALGVLLTTLVTPRLYQWMESSHVR